MTTWKTARERLTTTQIRVSPIEFSVAEHQLGLSAALVRHFSDQVHFASDYFRALFAWHQGEEQTVNFLNTGMTVQW